MPKIQYAVIASGREYWTGFGWDMDISLATNSTKRIAMQCEMRRASADRPWDDEMDIIWLDKHPLFDYEVNGCAS